MFDYSWWSTAGSYDAIVVEDIDLHGLAQALKFGRSISDNGFGMLRNFLAYKLSERGKYFIKIDKWFASSKICSSCGHKKAKLELSERTYNCDNSNCQLSIDRDLNAAINIKTAGMAELAW